ncbi:Cyclin-dependent kinase inhibitor [Cinara cedri]|uniref:Cyclin-dependent kinase inhibitor n=1 Tax=Cinara cedri TaxID=506608 RepID=A0A5E4MWH8_9HEMI|nr:Cyclin-dependent kinase inhibitor [Cinara cedri]
MTTDGVVRTGTARTLRARRRLFPRGDDGDGCAIATAERIGRDALARKRRRWGFDFVDGAPTADGTWRWEITATKAADNDGGQRGNDNGEETFEKPKEQRRNSIVSACGGLQSRVPATP